MEREDPLVVQLITEIKRRQVMDRALLDLKIKEFLEVKKAEEQPLVGLEQLQAMMKLDKEMFMLCHLVDYNDAFLSLLVTEDALARSGWDSSLAEERRRLVTEVLEKIESSEKEK